MSVAINPRLSQSRHYNVAQFLTSKDAKMVSTSGIQLSCKQTCTLRWGNCITCKWRKAPWLNSRLIDHSPVKIQSKCSWHYHQQNFSLSANRLNGNASFIQGLRVKLFWSYAGLSIFEKIDKGRSTDSRLTILYYFYYRLPGLGLSIPDWLMILDDKLNLVLKQTRKVSYLYVTCKLFWSCL